MIDTLITAIRMANLISTLRRQASTQIHESPSGQRDRSMGEWHFVLLPLNTHATNRDVKISPPIMGPSITFVSTTVSKQQSHLQQRQ